MCPPYQDRFFFCVALGIFVVLVWASCLVCGCLVNKRYGAGLRLRWNRMRTKKKTGENEKSNYVYGTIETDDERVFDELDF